MDYEDYLGLVLIYMANTTEGLSESESSYIFEEVGKDHYQKALDFFNDHSEYQVLQEIQKLSPSFEKERDEVLLDLKRIMNVDNIDPQLEQVVYSRLEKLI